jgi:transposase
VQRQADRDDPDPKALACFDAVRQDTGKVYLSFTSGQPNSESMWQFIMGLLAQARRENKRVVVLIWDQASWHTSNRITRWIRDYNQLAKQHDEPRLLTHLLPSKSPWLNPIEPRWIHAKRAVCEPDGDLTADELRQRISNYFDVEPFDIAFKQSA